MAKVVKGDIPSRSKAEAYPWGEWLDGRSWELSRGVDFDIDIGSFRNQVYMQAKRVGVSATVRKIDNDTIRVQARKATT